MSNKKEDIFLAFIFGFLTGIAFFSSIDKKRELRITKLNKLKDNLDKGFTLDKKNLTNDCQHIFYDLGNSFKKLKQGTQYGSA